MTCMIHHYEKIIGQLHNSYIMIETHQGLQILDQHALAERIIYERLVQQNDGHTTQWLLLSENIDLTPKRSRYFKWK